MRNCRYSREVDEAKRRIVSRALREAGGCHTLACRLLGINRTNFYRLLQRIGHEAYRPYGRRASPRGGNAAWQGLL